MHLTSYHLVNFAHVHYIHTRMLHHLTQYTTIPPSNNKHLAGVWVRKKRQMSDHLLISHLIPFGTLNYAIEDQHFPVRDRLKEQDVLKIRAFMKKDFFDLQGKTLACRTPAEYTENKNGASK